MPVLVAAVIVLAGVVVVNLLLTFGLVRRIRVHETRLAAVETGGVPEVMTVPVGEPIPAFNTLVPPGGAALFGFFSPHCEACHDRIPDFRAAAAARGGSAVAVVIRDGGDIDTLTAGLDGLRVVVEEPDGPLARAFGVRGFPAFAEVDASGILRSRGFEPPRSPS
jgi:hypothetical protein